MTKFYSYYKSPIGLLEVVTNSESLLAINFVENYNHEITISRVFMEVKRELDEYFNGKRKNFTIKCEAEGTDFQKKVWQSLQEIPYGETITYSEQAEIIGNKKATRAVGSANGKNPIPIIIPCHRVIGKNKKLTGYAGGLEIKEWLLEHEKRCK